MMWTVRWVRPTKVARRNRGQRRATVLSFLMILLVVGACHSWQPAPLPRAGDAPRPVAATARVTYVDGRVEQVARARVERDTLRAERAGVALAVPLDSVRAVHVRRLHWVRTLGLAAGVLGFSLLFGG